MFLHAQKVGLLLLVVCFVTPRYSLFAADKDGDMKVSSSPSTSTPSCVLRSRVISSSRQ